MSKFCNKAVEFVKETFGYLYPERDCREEIDNLGNAVLILDAQIEADDVDFELRHSDLEDDKWKYDNTYFWYEKREAPIGVDNDVAIVFKRKKQPRPEKKECRTLTLYHGTPEDRLQCINEKGLVSPCTGEAEKHPKGWKQEKDLIWFTDNMNMARIHAIYYNHPGYVITSEVEVCNPLPWGRELGEDIAEELNQKAPSVPCDYAKDRRFHPTKGGDYAIVEVAERCPEFEGMGETARHYGFDSFHEIIPPEDLFDEGANNWAVTDKNKKKILDYEYVPKEFQVGERENVTESSPKTKDKKKTLETIDKLREWQGEN